MLNPREYTEFIMVVREAAADRLSVDRTDLSVQVIDNEPYQGIILNYKGGPMLSFTGNEGAGGKVVSIGFSTTFLNTDTKYVGWEKVVARIRLSVYEIWRQSIKEKYTKKEHRQLLIDHGHYKLMT